MSLAQNEDFLKAAFRGLYVENVRFKVHRFQIFCYPGEDHFVRQLACQLVGRWVGPLVR